MKTVTARDGVLARDSGPWGLTKLSFLDHYCPAAIQATERKLQRYYIDLFAGPGVNLVRRTAATEYAGSPLRVLRYVGLQRTDLSFTHAVFINAMPRDHQAFVCVQEGPCGQICKGAVTLLRDRRLAWSSESPPYESPGAPTAAGPSDALSRSVAYPVEACG